MHSAVIVSVVSGGPGGIGRQPVYLTPVDHPVAVRDRGGDQLPAQLRMVGAGDVAFGARIVPCQATPWVTANPVASGRFHMQSGAVALPDRFMYIGAIDRIVSVVTLISAVAPGWVRLITTPAAWASWAASTVNTFRPGRGAGQLERARILVEAHGRPGCLREVAERCAQQLQRGELGVERERWRGVC